MLYECHRVRRIWKDLSSLLKCDITWKLIVCGFPKYESSNKIDCINYIISCIAYSVYKVNNICKSEKKPYKSILLRKEIKATVMYYLILGKSISSFYSNYNMYGKIMEYL